MSYPKRIPVDQGRSPMQDYPAAVTAQTRFYRDNGAASSVQTLTDNTTQIEVGAVGSGVILRWVPTSDGAGAPAGSVLSTNFDHFIPAAQVRKFVVPKESATVNSVVGVNIQQGLYRRMALANITTGSILSTEY